MSTEKEPESIIAPLLRIIGVLIASVVFRFTVLRGESQGAESYFISFGIVATLYVTFKLIWTSGASGRIWLGSFSVFVLIGWALGLLAEMQGTAVLIAIAIGLPLSSILAFLFRNKFEADFASSHEIESDDVALKVTSIAPSDANDGTVTKTVYIIPDMAPVMASGQRKRA